MSAGKKRRGRNPRGGRPEKRWTFDGSIALLDKKLKALGRREEAQAGERLGQGRGRADDEIPPGWIRA